MTELELTSEGYQKAKPYPITQGHLADLRAASVNSPSLQKQLKAMEGISPYPIAFLDTTFMPDNLIKNQPGIIRVN